jgi:hypothetical protein
MINPTTENFPRRRAPSELVHLIAPVAAPSNRPRFRVTGDRRTSEKRQKRREHCNVIGRDAVVRKLSNQQAESKAA